MEIQDKKIQSVREQVEKAKRQSGRPNFSKSLKQEIASILQSGVTAIDLAQMTGLSISSMSRWRKSKPAAVFHKVSKEIVPKISSNEGLSFKLTLPNGILIESESELLLRKVFELCEFKK